MRANRNDSIEVMNVITNATAPAHLISRLLTASEERVRSVLLDPALRAIWAISDLQTTSVPPHILEQGYVILKELVQDHVIDVRIHLLKRAHMCEIHVELRIDRSFDPSTFYGIGIDDLWEKRLYAIADLVIPTDYSKS